MEKKNKKYNICVVGSGASGLPAIKTCLEYGFNVKCFEKSNDIGGLWRYKSNPEDDEGTVMKSTVINTSKEMTAYSDFPPPKHFANYMHNRQMLEYLNLYADNFKLRQYILFKHKVLTIDRHQNFNVNHQWKVTYCDMEKDEIYEELFDGVMMCTGHHSIPYWPEPFEGQSRFKGKIIHSHSFNSCIEFSDQTVVVVGIGNSGGDIAVELSKICKNVYLSTRSGSWVVNRVYNKGEPSDLVYFNRAVWYMKKFTPKWYQNYVLEKNANKRFDHGRFGLKPNHRFLEAHVTVNDELPNRIISGTVIIKPNIMKYSETGVIFEDGTCIDNVDTVIYATGYSFTFDQIEDGELIPIENNKVLLYKYMYTPELSPYNNLAIIGLIQPTGSIMPISEMQTRLFCSVLTGNTTLPSKNDMILSALKTNLSNQQNFIQRRRHALQVNYVTYMDSIAQMIKCKPNIIKYIFTDYELAKKLIFHGLVPYQYRLDGPHKWNRARKAIMEMEERVFECTKTRRTPETEKSKPIHKCYPLHILF